MLLDLVRKLQQEHAGIEHIQVRFSDEGLELEYDPQQGFRGYEHVKAIPYRQKSYSLVYTALLPTAQETFSHPTAQERISSNRFLTSLRKEIHKSRQDTSKAGKTAEKLMGLHKEDLLENDLASALDFFSATFRRKAGYA